MKKIYKNMKERLSAIGLVAAMCSSLFLGGCSDDFLKPDPLSFYEPGITFTTESGMQAVLAQADRHLRSYWTSYENRNISVPIGTEYLFSELSVASKTDDSALFSDVAKQMTPTSSAGYDAGDWRSYFWDETYNGIKYANTITTFINNVGGLDETTKNAYLGRAYFHRSFRYLSLVFQFGDVPLVTTILSVPKQNYRSTKKEAILDMITKDMEFAVEWVPEQKDMKYAGMINKGACRMLLIKCYLVTGQFQKAKDQADILINDSGYSLMQDTFGSFVDSYSPQTWKVTRNVIWDLHRPENKLASTNKEVIMGMVNRGATAESMIEFLTMRIFGPSYTSGSDLKTPDGKQAVQNYARNNANYNPNYDYIRSIGRGIATWRLTWFATNTMWKVNGVDDKGDLRHNSTVGNWGRMDSIKYNDPSSAWFGKNIMFKHPETGDLLCTDSLRVWFDWPQYKIYLNDVVAEANRGANQFNGATNGGIADWYLYRLAEAYLLRAEAKFYLGDSSGAASDVNEVRKRAKCTELYTTVTIGDIMDERARELYLEEWRNVELKRVSYCLALSGKPDEWGNTYDVNTLYKESGTDVASGGSYWYKRVTRYGMYNQGPRSVRPNTFNYQMDKCNFCWPIPNSAITANNKGKLSQNYGYDGYDPTTPKWEKWEDAVNDEFLTE
ncbi:RagB/SusD family nutrient uptake outer membrane protein [Dysgonomonas sp. Marseille-P4677]|uniref:RagB/SusD family nutrient uptake outer membrane protein n=1 Tax=Dysgonomonas sp. Marseille-P4677 TaxID=2364790 RepID=UPI00191349FE|nr:RagB/SusD family nutrient uptake outer membrane protein [Dysgonomonas sp. Marseille-P4677]MBK5722727.1 RagB/SusD family nutrient uptake outer membrane protein [Dysgonomonas sp. Marseille-P4677]